MRRVVIATAFAGGLLLVASPAQAFAHNAVHNPYLHAVLDVLTLAVVATPAITVYLWGPKRRGLLLTLVAVVQLPVAIIGFVPIVNPILHITASTAALALIVACTWAVRRLARHRSAAEAVPATD
jgi:hypothetical protein